MDFNLNANDRSQGWKFSLSHQQALKSMEKQRKSGRNEMQLKTGREAWKNRKTEISQTVGNQFATIANFAISWQTVRITKFANHIHCAFAKFASHIKLQNLSEISHCQLRNAIANFAIPLPTSQHHCQLRNSLANFATHCQIR